MYRNKVLLVEDDVDVRVMLRDFLQTKGYAVHEADTTVSAKKQFETTRFDVAVTDYELPDGTALELLSNFKAVDPKVPIVIVSGYGTLEIAVQAGQRGAERFLAKPVPPKSLHRLLEGLLKSEPIHDTGALEVDAIDPLVGESAAIRVLRTHVAKLLHTHNPVLIQGETGTGKGVLARWIHRHGPRSKEAFVDLNCAGLADELLDSELFGHEQGAFTGAIKGKTGLLEVAHRGTVFLDEIGDMPLLIQGRLLKVLEEKIFRRVGGVREQRVDVRIVAATNRELWGLVHENRFRSDLLYRLDVFPVEMPPLRERREDIPVLARQLVARLTADTSRPPAEIDPTALAVLQDHTWPGNIRQLKNVLERALLLGDDVITESDLTLEGNPRSSTPDSKLTLGDLERVHILRVLEQEDGHVGRTASRLGVARSSLYQKIKKFGGSKLGSA